jgi:hypothetical protein
MNSMKNWNVYLPNGEAVTVIGEIECREGKYYFKNGDEVVAVFNDDKVCGVHGVERKPTLLEVTSGQERVFPPTVYPTGKEG